MLSIYNTLTRKKEVFKPIDEHNVRMYVCGMTIYDYCHIGHARVMVVFDMVSRWLRQLGYPLTYVRNITDIDDKIIKRAIENNETIGQLTERFIQAMHEDSEALGILPPDYEPRATEYIGNMLSLIQKLIDNGVAYAADNGDVYYSVRDFPQYGQLSGKSLDDLRAGERVDIDQHKKDPLDFVLWKAAKPGEPSWESPWGAGRPGWHIECSAMSEKLLGAQFDIHGGGADLQFPHHENEIAQSCGAQDKNHQHPFVNYWMHNEFIRVDNEKMSKSLGNFFTIREVLQKYDAEVIRFFIIRTHYRSPVNYSDIHLNDAKNALTRMYTALKNSEEVVASDEWQNHPYSQRFYAAMNDDFNTPEAVAVLFELISEINKTGDAMLAGILRKLANILGLLDRDPASFLQGTTEQAGGLSNEQIEQLLLLRQTVRAEKNWAESDRIRDELASQGIVIEDSAQGTSWRRS